MPRPNPDSRRYSRQSMRPTEAVWKFWFRAGVMSLITWFFALMLLSLQSVAHAHGGGLNADGCHNNRKTGDYHCHRGGGGRSSGSRLAESAKAEVTPSTSTSRAIPPGCFTGPRGGTWGPVVARLRTPAVRRRAGSVGNEVFHVGLLLHGNEARLSSLASQGHYFRSASAAPKLMWNG